MQRPTGAVDRLPGGGQHVPEEEEQDPDRDGVQQHPQRGRRTAQPADRQTEEDRPAGDRTQYRYRGWIHDRPNLNRLT